MRTAAFPVLTPRPPSTTGPAGPGCSNPPSSTSGVHSEQEIRRLLLQLNARVIDGPSSVGAYRLEIREKEQQHALALLRADPAVAFAEPMPAQGRARK